MPSETELTQHVEACTATLAEAGAAADYWYDRVAELTRETYGDRLREAQARYDRVLSEVQQRLAHVEREAGLWALPWTDEAWQTYRPARNIPTPRVTRIGELTEQGPFGLLRMPALLSIVGARNVLIQAAGPAREQANLALQAIALRLLATLPPGKLLFTFIDPVDRGRNMAGFMHLTDHVEALVGGHVWTESNRIQQELEDLTARMDIIIQKYLRDRYPTIEAYNAEAGEVEEPYRLVVVANFPVGFTEESAKRLVSIARSGRECGVHVIASVDTEVKLPYNFSLADLEETATIITHDGRRFVWQDDVFRGCALTLDGLPPTDEFDRIIHAVGQTAEASTQVQVPFKRIVPDQDGWWQASAAQDIRIPIGRVGARNIQYLEFGRGTAQHALVVGKTGSGKSTLLHVFITSLAVTHSPDEALLYLVDFKKGVEFKDYAVHQLPHARVIAIQSEREFGLSVLQGLDFELQRRGDLFREAGCAELRDYRARTRLPMPRLLLVVDEFQEFFSEDDALAAQASLILDRLVRQGRAFGIHILLGSQSLAGAYTMARSTIDQMAIRIALQCSDADSRLILSDDNDAARLLGRPGEAIYNSANGLVEGNATFQIVWLPPEEREDYLDRIRAHAEQAGYVAGRAPIVFEGNEPARIENNHDLQALVERPQWPPRSPVVSAWLGEPVAIREHHTAARFRRQSRCNLLVVGQDEQAGTGMVMTALASLAAQQPESDAQFYVLDLSSADGPTPGLVKRMADSLPHRVKVVRHRRDIAPLMQELAGLVEARLQQEADEAAGSSIYLAVLGLHQARDLRSDDGPLGWSLPSRDEPAAAPDPAECFATIVRDGPDVGIHTLVWCNTHANLNRILERRGIAEFDMRVVMQMSAEASNNLLDSPAANKLGPNRAYYYDEEQVGHLEKFRPYALPPENWLSWAGQELRKR